MRSVPRLNQLQDVFAGGANGLGAAINDMMNAVLGRGHRPTDLSARNLVLTRIDETAGRMRTAAERLDEIQATVRYELDGAINDINTIAKSLASVNEQIAAPKGSGQPPNDLLDQRDTLIRNLNRYLQTTQVEADDGSMSVFVASSQPLVLGTTAATLSIDNASLYPGSAGF